MTNDLTQDQDQQRREPRNIETRVDTLMGEFRIVTPALAAVLGFQLISAFQQSFQELAPIVKWANFAGLACNAFALLFLLVPASYHRATAGLEASSDYLQFSQKSFGLAFIFIPLGLSFSLYVQAIRTFDSPTAAALTGAAFYLAFMVAWWVVPIRRAKRRGTIDGRFP